MNSGDGTLSTPSGNRADEFDQYLAGLEKKHGLSDFERHPYLAAPEAELRALLAEDCYERAQILARWGMKVQRVSNSYAARARWCRSSIGKLIGATMAGMRGVYSVDERRALAMVDCPAAQDLEKQLVVAEAMVERLAFVPARIEESRRTYVAMADSRRRRT
jgi:hypothetical protein